MLCFHRASSGPRHQLSFVAEATSSCFVRSAIDTLGFRLQEPSPWLANAIIIMVFSTSDLVPSGQQKETHAMRPYLPLKGRLKTMKEAEAKHAVQILANAYGRITTE